MLGFEKEGQRSTNMSGLRVIRGALDNNRRWNLIKLSLSKLRRWHEPYQQAVCIDRERGKKSIRHFPESYAGAIAELRSRLDDGVSRLIVPTSLRTVYLWRERECFYRLSLLEANSTGSKILAALHIPKAFITVYAALVLHSEKLFLRRNKNTTTNI